MNFVSYSIWPYGAQSMYISILFIRAPPPCTHLFAVALCATAGLCWLCSMCALCRCVGNVMCGNFPCGQHTWVIHYKKRCLSCAVCDVSDVPDVPSAFQLHQTEALPHFYSPFSVRHSATWFDKSGKYSKLIVFHGIGPLSNASNNHWVGP